MLTKEELKDINPKSLWIFITEETDFDALDFDDMFILCNEEGYMKLYNGRASIYFSDRMHPTAIDDDDDDDHLAFFAYQCDEKGICHLKLTEAGKKHLLNWYDALLPLNFNIYQTFKKYFESDVSTDSVLHRSPLLLIYENGYIDTLSWMEYHSTFDKNGEKFFSFPYARLTTERMNNVEYCSMPGEGLDEISLKFVLDMNKCPLTKIFK